MQTILANGNERETAEGASLRRRVSTSSSIGRTSFRSGSGPTCAVRRLFSVEQSGMLNMATEVTSVEPFTEMVTPIYQLTWSAGGDALVVRDAIQKPGDLKGRRSCWPMATSNYLTTVL